MYGTHCLPLLTRLYSIASVLQDLSQLLNTGLDKNQLKACVELIENGINAEAVAVSRTVVASRAVTLLIVTHVVIAEDCTEPTRRSAQRRGSQGKGCQNGVLKSSSRTWDVYARHSCPNQTCQRREGY